MAREGAAGAAGNLTAAVTSLVGRRRALNNITCGFARLPVRAYG
jgi:hypothetical protein